MNKGDLINKIADQADLSKSQAEDALNAALNAISDSLKDDDSVTIVGFGTFSISRREARQGRNPRTGETIQIAAKNSVKFKAGKKLNDAVN